jgi:hypothetical protein
VRVTLDKQLDAKQPKMTEFNWKEIRTPVKIRPRTDCTLDVLATDPKEINKIANVLREPSRELLVGASLETRPPDGEEINRLLELVAFQAVGNLGCEHESINKARRFVIRSSLPSNSNRCLSVPGFGVIYICSFLVRLPRHQFYLRLEGSDPERCGRTVGVG